MSHGPAQMADRCFSRDCEDGGDRAVSGGRFLAGGFWQAISGDLPAAPERWQPVAGIGFAWRQRCDVAPKSGSRYCPRIVDLAIVAGFGFPALAFVTGGFVGFALDNQAYEYFSCLVHDGDGQFDNVRTAVGQGRDYVEGGMVGIDEPERAPRLMNLAPGSLA